MMEDLLRTACLPGRWYKVFADNCYNNDCIVEHLAATYSIYMGGTLQRSDATPLVRIGTATKPHLTIANPKGTLRLAKKTTSDVYIYSCVYSALVTLLTA